MSARTLIALAMAAAAVVLGVIGVALMRGGTDDGPSTAAPGTGVADALANTTSASAPFAGLTEARLALGDRCLRVAIADETTERQQGLRNVTDLGPYDGMLFVYGSDSDAQFTMSSTPLPLDIGWYAADGSPVDRTTMQPCPTGTDASCPLYASSGRYRYALETPAGGGSAGAIGACGA